ncbi:nuclear transport factor 2 family protein [Actinocatenispora sera]|uniref:nuclear transport factor 2 family protein n=1 Tax=Actinocatenispora sera TaxID=390989 RepID=UPI0034045784
MIEPSRPEVRQFVAAVNAGDRAALTATLTADATMSDDGTDRDLREWTEREIFTSNGTMAVESESDDGLDLLVRYTNSTWGAMNTRWHFVVADGRISRFETGQA